MAYAYVDDSWNVKDLKAECKRRGMDRYSSLRKHELIDELNWDIRNMDGLVDTDWTIEDLRAECKRRGIGGYSRLREDDLMFILNRDFRSSVQDAAHDFFASCDQPGPQEPVSPTSEYSIRQQQGQEEKEFADDAYRSGLYEPAVMLYSQAIRMADQQDIEKRACLFANRAAALMNLGRDADAVRDCKEALRLKPEYPRVLLRKGRLHARLDQWELAIEALSTCLHSATALHAQVRDAAAELEQCWRSQRDDQDDIYSIGHYATLGVRFSATAREVKVAHRNLVLEHHPDKNQGDPSSVERFRAIQAAYEVLKDRAQREAYDSSLRHRQANFSWWDAEGSVNDSD